MANPIDAGSIYSDVRIRLDRLNGDIKSVQKSFDKITKTTKTTAGKTDKIFKGMFSSLKLGWVALGAAIVSLGFQTLKYFKDSEKAAREAQEVYSKFDTVFESITDSANESAEAFADSFGLADSTAKELLGTTGDLLVGMGATEEQSLALSEKVNTLAADLASFSNIEGGTARASKALTAALLGEREQAKLLGVVIRESDVQTRLAEQGKKDLTGQALLLAKAEITLQLATEQSQKALGDYARTADSAANVEKRLHEQTKGLKEAIGAGLLPTVTAIREKLGEWAEAVTEVINRNNELRDAEKAVAEGNASIEQKITLLKHEIDLENQRLQASRDSGRLTESTIALKEELAKKTIAGLNSEIDIQERLLATQKAYQKAISDQDKEAQAIALREQAVAEAQLSALEELTKRQFDALSPQEQRLQLIQQEIDSLAAQRAEAKELGVEWQSIQDLINDLYKEKADLIREDKKSFEISGKSWLEIEQEKVDHLVWIDNLETEINERRKEESDELLAKERANLQKKIDLTFTYAGLVTGILTSLNDLRAQQNQAELDDLQATLDAKLKAAEDEGATEEELTQLKTDNAKEYNDLKQKFAIEEAKRNKKLALLNIAINTASAVVAALVSIPPNVPLSIAVGATGLAQAAIVQSQPLPKFATGGIVMPSQGGSIVNVAENGSPELMLNSGASGQALLGDFANQIVEKMGGGNMSFQLVLPNGDVIAEAVAPAFNNGRVELKV